MQQHVKAPLQKRRIDGRHRDHPLLGHARRHRDGVLLRDAHVEEPVRQHIRKMIQSRPIFHRRRDRAHAAVLAGERRQLLAEHIGECLRARFQRLAAVRVKFSNSVELLRTLLRRDIALPLLCDEVDNDRFMQGHRRPQNFRHLLHVVAVHRPEIRETQRLKERRAEQAPPHPLLDLVRQLVEFPPRGGLRRRLAVPQLESDVFWPQPRPRQIPRDRAHVARDAHAVVVQDHDHRLAADARVVQPLIGQSAGQGPIAEQRRDLIILAPQRPRPRHAQRDRHRVRRMPRHKGVAFALARLWKSCDPAVLPQRVKPFHPPGQDLMHIGLMPHIEDQPVTPRIEYRLDRDRRLHDPEIRRQMAARPADVLDQKLPDLRAERPLLLRCQPQQIVSGMYRL